MEKNNSINLKEVGQRIRHARKALNLSQQNAAERASISAQYWSSLEVGRDQASVMTYLRIATAFGMTLDDLFYDDATLLRVRTTFSLDGLLEECTVCERAVLSEALLALKAILGRHRCR